MWALVGCSAGGTLAAQSTNVHKPQFSLKMSTVAKSVIEQKQLAIELKVQVINRSNHVLYFPGSSDPGSWFTMKVLCNGNPAPATGYSQVPYNPPNPPEIQMENSTFGMRKLEPGKAMTYSVPITSYFDFSVPGSYEIALSRIANNGQSDNIQVFSNTLVIEALSTQDISK
jgi:hypothetical protein